MKSLLEILNDGDFHSGDDIGLALGVGRAAVWKKINGLRVLGLGIDSVKGRGYRLSASAELLDQQKIVDALPQCMSQVDVRCLISVGSTNDYVMDCARKGEARQLFCFAEHQTSGRGRRGRQWESPFGSNLYLSTSWTFSQGAAALDGLSLVVGLAVRRAICGLLDVPVLLKWPNDLISGEGYKLAGILLEISGDPSGECRVVIGVGVNLYLSQEQRNSISQPCTDLFQLAGKRVSKNALASALIVELMESLAVFERSGFDAFMAEWDCYDAFRGDIVSVQVSAGNWVEGRCLGVDANGALLVDTEGEVMAYRGGEVSLRRSLHAT